MRRALFGARGERGGRREGEGERASCGLLLLLLLLPMLTAALCVKQSETRVMVTRVEMQHSQGP